MSSAKQKAAARRNIKKAVTAAKRKKTISHLSKATREAGSESSETSQSPLLKLIARSLDASRRVLLLRAKTNQYTSSSRWLG